MTNAGLESRMQVAEDTKKLFRFDKHTGTWSWYNKAEHEGHGPFPTFFAAVVDATEPYFNEDSHD